MQSNKVLNQCHLEQSDKSCKSDFIIIIKIYPFTRNENSWLSNLKLDNQTLQLKNSKNKFKDYFD